MVRSRPQSAGGGIENGGLRLAAGAYTIRFVMMAALKAYFASRRDVAFAFLYGSQANGTATARSDVDVAVYFVPKIRRPLEFEEDVRYDAEDEVWAGLERLVGKEVELLVLNRAPAGVAVAALKGTPLTINDWRLFLDFFEVASRVATDFGDSMVRDFKERNGLADRSQEQVR